MATGKDYLARDNKRLPMSKRNEALVPFLIWCFVGIPLLVAVVLPLTIASQVVLWLLKTAGLVAKRPSKSSVVPALEGNEAAVPPSVKPRDQRKYDLVLFGATGFTGQLAARYLADKYGNRVRWAIAGRRADALEKLKAELDAPYVPTLVADVNDPESLRAVISETKVVITTVGPFQRYGTRLVQLCALHGTDYCDITGESDWVRQMIDKFDGIAKRSGARIVHFCGHDCVPWDLAVMEAARVLKEKYGEDIQTVHCFDEIRGSASGGTLETIFMSLEGREPVKSELGFDPMLKSASGNKSEYNMRATNQKGMGYSSERKAWVGPFVMAMVMANCIRRSNALNGYNKSLRYSEAMVYPSFFAGAVMFLTNVAFGMALFCPPLKWILRKFVLPSPGEGPSVSSMDKGFLKIKTNATGHKGTLVENVIYFPTDPGYRDTARMLVESGLSFVEQSNEIKSGGGVFTPAACQGKVLLNRLIKTGTEFETL